MYAGRMTVTIEFAAKVHGYRRGERAEVDASDQRVADLIEGKYAFEVEAETREAEQADPAPAGDQPPPTETVTTTSDPVGPDAPTRQGRRGTTT